LAATKGKQLFVFDLRSVFQNTIQVDAQKRTYNIIPPFFSEYLRLHWPYHPDLEAIATNPHLYAIQKL
jgi:hypothetical protein